MIEPVDMVKTNNLSSSVLNLQAPAAYTYSAGCVDDAGSASSVIRKLVPNAAKAA
jgi:hypothetical protein